MSKDDLLADFDAAKQAMLNDTTVSESWMPCFACMQEGVRPVPRISSRSPTYPSCPKHVSLVREMMREALKDGR